MISFQEHSQKIDEKLTKIPGAKITKGVMFFSDIKESSKMWANSPKDMMIALTEHFKRTIKISAKHNGIIIKTIGDAFMIYFTEIENAVKAAMEIQSDLQDNPIKTKKKTIHVRIGICEGEMYEKKIVIQENTVKDFFGEAVNAASRLEHEVSDTNGIVFGSYISEFANKDILDTLSIRYHIDMIDYKHTCSKDVKRSGRMLTDEHRYFCSDISKLHGIDPIKVIKCNLK